MTLTAKSSGYSTPSNPPPAKVTKRAVIPGGVAGVRSDFLERKD